MLLQDGLQHLQFELSFQYGVGVCRRLVVHDRETGDSLEDPQPVSIGVVDDPALGCSGPLWVRGRIRIESEDGTPYEARNRMALCRCGGSSNKPFCDGTHANIDFKATGREPV